MAFYFDIMFEEDMGMILKFQKDKLIPSRISYNQLSVILINFLKHRFVQEWHYYVLPPNTFIGKILRKRTIIEGKYFYMVLNTYIKSIFSKNLVVKEHLYSVSKNLAFSSDTEVSCKY